MATWMNRQTPGSLRKSIVARRFRQKPLRRSVALRGNAEKLQPNTLYTVVAWYLTSTPLLPAYPLVQLMQEGSGDLQEGHPSATKGASPSAKHPLKVPFTKA